MFRRTGLFICIIFMGIATVCAQTIDSILALPLQAQYDYFYWDIRDFHYDTVTKKHEEAVVESERAGDINRAMFMFVRATVGMAGIGSDLTLEEKLEILDERITIAQKKKWEQAEAELWILRGQLLCKDGDWGRGFQQALKGYHLLKKLKVEPFIFIDNLNIIGTIYLDFGEYHSAIRILKEAAAIKTEIPFFVTPGVLNGIGLSYFRLQQYDSAYHYYILAKESAALSRPKLIPIINGNIGVMLYLMGRDDEAVPLLEEDFKLSDKYSGSNAASKLALIEAKRGNRDKALFYDQYVESVWDTTDAHGGSRYHEYKYDLNHYLGDYKSASHHIRLARMYKNQLAVEKDATAIKEANLKVNVELHAAEVRLLEEQRQRQVLLRNGLLLVIMLIGISGFLVIKRIQDQHHKKLELAAIQAEADAQRISRAETELSQFTKTLVEKNEIIENFNQKISELNDLTSSLHDAREVRVADMMQLSLLTDHDWQYFRKLFDEVHPGFSSKLIGKYPDLTPAEVRLLTLTKLQFPTRHMAHMLGISPDSVKKTRNRLRKKINLPEEGSLEDVIKDI